MGSQLLFPPCFFFSWCPCASVRVGFTPLWSCWSNSLLFRTIAAALAVFRCSFHLAGPC